MLLILLSKVYIINSISITILITIYLDSAQMVQRLLYSVLPSQLRRLRLQGSSSSSSSSGSFSGGRSLAANAQHITQLAQAACAYYRYYTQAGRQRALVRRGFSGGALAVGLQWRRYWQLGYSKLPNIALLSRTAILELRGGLQWQVGSSGRQILAVIYSRLPSVAPPVRIYSELSSILRRPVIVVCKSYNTLIKVRIYYQTPL